MARLRRLPPDVQRSLSRIAPAREPAAHVSLSHTSDLPHEPRRKRDDALHAPPRDRDLAHRPVDDSAGFVHMKLNATAEMLPISWPEFAEMHPFVPPIRPRAIRS